MNCFDKTVEKEFQDEHGHFWMSVLLDEGDEDNAEISLVNLHFSLYFRDHKMATTRITLKRVYNWEKIEHEGFWTSELFPTTHWFMASFISPTYRFETESDWNAVQERVWQIINQFEEFDGLFFQIDFSIPEGIVFTHSMTQKKVNE